MFIKKRFLVPVAVVLLMLVLAACGGNNPATPGDTQQAGQKLTEDYQKAAQAAVPYPLAAMKKGGWLELRLLKENLLRQNDAHRIAYVTLLNVQGQPIIQYTIQGMVFDLNSQMSTQDKINTYDCGDHCGWGVTTRSPGDNGTWGPEPSAISFFTTEGVQIKWNGLYLESDSPQNITTKPLIVYDASSAKPSVSGGGVADVKKGGIDTKSTTATKAAAAG